MAGLSAPEIMKLMQEVFPLALEYGFEIDRLEGRQIQLRLPFKEYQLRPGGTLSGPTLMALADTAVYFLILAERGAVVQAMTTHLSIDLVRPPKPVDLVAYGELIKCGRRLAVGRDEMRSVGQEDVLAQAMVTFALPS